MEVVDMMQLTASHDFGLQLVEAMRKEPKETFPVCPYCNIDFRKLVDKLELMHGDSLSDSVDFVLNVP